MKLTLTVVDLSAMHVLTPRHAKLTLIVQISIALLAKSVVSVFYPTGYVTDLLSIATPVCNDTVKNSKETDVDCGGPTCNGCAFQKSCKVNTDCIGNLCQSLICGKSQPSN